MRLTHEQVAGVCYNANAMLQDALGDAYVPPPWHVMTAAQKAPYIRGVQIAAYLTPPEQHQRWMDDKARDGWVHGPRVDYEARTHPCMVPWDQLDEGQKLKDYLFQAIVRALR